MAEDKKDWTIMIYMAGDNNLSIDMAYALQQIKDVVKGNDKINLFVYYDGYSPSVPTLYCDFSGDKNQIYYRSYKTRKLYSQKTQPNENSAAATSVINFVDWCVNQVEYKKDGKTYKGRKADKYALIFSGHTSGIHDIGFLRDEKSNYHMTMAKVLWLLGRITKSTAELEADVRKEQKFRRNKGYPELNPADIKRETKLILGQKLSVLGFDSCIMSLLEVGYQFKSVAETMVASEGSIPNAGWTYAQILGALANKQKDSRVTEIAQDFVFQFIKKQDTYTIGGVTVDMAAWDLGVLEKLEAPFEKLITHLLECFKTKESLIYKQMKRVLLQVHWQCQSYMFEQNIDLSDFCLLLKKEVVSLQSELGESEIDKLQSISECCDDVIKQIRECIILSGFCGGAYQYSNGISLFFPWSASGYSVSRKNYEELLFIKYTEAGKKWNKFLQIYLGEVSFRRGKAPSKKVFPGLSISINAKDNKPGDAPDISYYSYVYKNDKLPVNGEGSISAGENNQNPLTANKTVVNAEDRTTVNAADRTTVNAEDRTTVNAEDRMGTLNLFFAELLRFKNIGKSWNISGFTKTPSQILETDGSLSEDMYDSIKHAGPVINAQ